MTTSAHRHRPPILFVVILRTLSEDEGDEESPLGGGDADFSAPASPSVEMTVGRMEHCSVRRWGLPRQCAHWFAMTAIRQGTVLCQHIEPSPVLPCATLRKTRNVAKRKFYFSKMLQHFARSFRHYIIVANAKYIDL